MMEAVSDESLDNVVGGLDSYICKKHMVMNEVAMTVSFCSAVIGAGYKVAGGIGATLAAAGCIGYKVSDILYAGSLQNELVYDGIVRNVK